MLVVVGGIKGGAGKSTIAVNLAVARSRKHQVLLVDGDDQESSSLWYFQRQSGHPDRTPNLSHVKVSGEKARKDLVKYLEKYEDIIVDVGGRDTTTQRAALSVADLYLIPLQPRSVDLWTLDDVSIVIEEILTINSKLKSAAFINRAFSAGKDNDESMELIKQVNNIELAPIKIGDRKVFSTSFGNGLAVPENKPTDRKALEELQSLYLYCYHRI